MRGLYIIVEGATEVEFVNQLLIPYFISIDIMDVRAISMNTSKDQKGGAVSYGRYKNNVEKLLNQESDVLVTSLIDYFKLDTAFPKYKEAILIADKIQKVTFLEQAIADDINNRKRFVPYIQLHEFEALLFSDKVGLDYVLNILPQAKKIPRANIQELYKAVTTYDNPELLNDGADTAPSKRLERLLKPSSYGKKLHGNLMAVEITINPMKTRCVRFNNWLEILSKKMKE
jgi:Domain of unknown function (DUF4276)